MKIFEIAGDVLGLGDGEKQAVRARYWIDDKRIDLELRGARTLLDQDAANLERAGQSSRSIRLSLIRKGKKIRHTVEVTAGATYNYQLLMN